MQGEPETRSAPDSTRPDKVWLQLADLFGNAHYREHGESPGPLWKEAIWKLTDVELARGLNNLAGQELKFPVNLPQFVTACKLRDAGLAPYWNQPKLSHPSSTKARSLINRILVKTLTDIGGVDSAQLQKLVSLKNALLEEVDQIHPPLEWADSAYEQLTAMAMLHDREARSRETAFARQRLK